MMRRPPRSTRTDTLFPYTTLFRSQIHAMVVFLLDHLPTTLHLIMTTRSDPPLPLARLRSEEHTSELQSLMRISYAVFCLKKKNMTTRKDSTGPTDSQKIQ